MAANKDGALLECGHFSVRQSSAGISPMSVHLDNSDSPVFSEPLATSSFKDELSAVSEHQIVYDLIVNCFQGMEGKYIKYDNVNQCFILDPLISVRGKNLILRLAGFGNLIFCVKRRADAITKGSATNYLTEVIRKEISRYYHDLTCLYDEQRATTANMALAEQQMKGTTLVQLDCWSQRHVRTFRVLHDVLKFTDGKHVGEIVSFLSNRLRDVDPAVSPLMKKLFVVAFHHLHKMIVDWMTKGELNDEYDEFFIKLNPEKVEEKDIWDSQFVLRRDVIPKIISKEQAMQILRTGHYVHFLHNMCHERVPLTPSQQLLKDNIKFPDTELSRLFGPDCELSVLIENACTEMSKLALDVLKTRFNFDAHLEALRKYMLLEDGDFVHCFMETLQNDLDKRANALNEYALQTVLNNTIELTNAKNDSTDVLSRLYVKKMVSSDNESGWDVFCLVYALDGPLNTVFKVSNGDYSRMFKFLWRTKRAQYYLARKWKDMTLLYKKISSIIPELRSAFVLARLLVNSMLQFVNNFQYHITFKVIEMSWISFQDDIRRMKTLDAVVNAHSLFMTSVQKGCLFHDVDTMCSVRSVFNCILELIPVIEIMCYDCEAEYNRRKQYEADNAKYGTSHRKEEEYQQGVAAFTESLKASKRKIRLVTKNFKDDMGTLLPKLSENDFKFWIIKFISSNVIRTLIEGNLDRLNRSDSFASTAGSSTNS